MKSLFTQPMQLTGKVLDLQLQRQNVVMSNLANIRTPGYNAKRLDFEQDLQKALGLDMQGNVTRTARQHIPVTFDADSFQGDLITSYKARVIHGEDRVDLDKEMVIMSKNSLNYNALTTVVAKQYEGLKNIITEGGRS